MRILICCEFYPPSIGGVQKVMQEVAEGLARRGHQVTVATSKLKERDFNKLNSVTIKEFDVKGNLVTGITGEVARYREFVVGGKFDAILVYAAQQWTFDALWEILPSIQCRKVHVPCGYSGLYDPRYSEYFQNMPVILREFDHLIFHASCYRDIQFARAKGFTNFSVIPNGASEAEFSAPPIPDLRQKLGISEKEFVFLTVGNPRLQKGHLEVAEAYSLMELPFPSVLILNDRPRPDNQSPASRVLSCMKALMIHRNTEEGKLWNTIRRCRRLPGKRLLLTNLKRDEVISAFFISDLFVFASRIEYSPLVLFESAAAGLPFLSVSVGNASEIAQWTGAGVICQGIYDKRGFTLTDPNVLAREMSRLAKDPQLLEELGWQGRKNWKERFSWNRIVSKYEDVLIGKAGCTPKKY